MSSIIGGKVPIVKTSVDGAPILGQIRILGFRFANTSTAVAGNCTVTDDLGNPIFHGVTTTGVGVDSMVFPFKPLTVGGYQVTVLTGAGSVLDIYAE